MKLAKIGVVIVAFNLSGCASLAFSDNPPPDHNALAFRESVPYLAVAHDGDCKITVSLISLPGKTHYVQLRPGLGSSELGVTLDNGMIKSVTQKADPEVAPLITALSSAGAFGMTESKPTGCNTGLDLYPLDENGAPIPDPLHYR